MSRLIDKSIAGIKVRKDGSAVIPSSRRADGSERAAIKVRPGFIPDEDVKRYSAGPERSVEQQRIPGTAVDAPKLSDSAKKRLAKKKNEKLEWREDTAKRIEPKYQSNNGLCHNLPEATAVLAETKEDADIKKARNIRKKVKQIKELQKRARDGETLEAEQLVKISKLEELEAEMAKVMIMD